MSYPLHPFTIHFPLGLLLTATVLELLALRRGEGASEATKLMLRIGWWAALIALGSGTIDLMRQLGRVQAALGWVNTHVAASLVALFIYSRLTFRSSLDSRQRARLHLIGGALLLLSGFVGGHMVYGLGFGSP